MSFEGGADGPPRPGGGGVPPGGGASRPGGGTVGSGSSTDMASVMSMLQSSSTGAIDVDMLRLLNQVDIKSAEVQTFGAEAQAELAAALAEANAAGAGAGAGAGGGGMGPGGGGVGSGAAGGVPATATKEELQLLMQSLSRATASGNPESTEFAAMMAAINDSASTMTSYQDDQFVDLSPPPPLTAAGSRQSLTGGMGAEAYTTHDGTMQAGPVGGSAPRPAERSDPQPFATLPPPTSDAVAGASGGMVDVGTSSAPTLASLPVADAPVEVDECVKHGWMEKLGGRKKDKWQRRWAELDMDPSPDAANGGGFTLSYKASPMDKKMKGTINLTSCAVTSRVGADESAGKDFVIKLAPAYGAKKKVYVLGFFDEKERDDWLAALNNAVKYNAQNRGKLGKR